MKSIIKFAGFAVLSVILSSMAACNDEFGEDEDKYLVEVREGSGLVTIYNNSRYEVSVRINSVKNTIPAYSGSGAVPLVRYSLSAGTQSLYYHPASKVRVSGVGSSVTIRNK